MSSEAGRIYTVNSRKFDGTVRRSWICELVSWDDEKIDLVGSFDEAVQHPDLGSIKRGTISYERFYFNRWYNYFIFKHPDGQLRNYYINICMPPAVSEGVIDYVDLDIDIIIWPDGKFVTLDLDEFEANATRYDYPESLRTKALETLSEIQTAGPSIF